MLRCKSRLFVLMRVPSFHLRAGVVLALAFSPFSARAAVPTSTVPAGVSAAAPSTVPGSSAPGAVATVPPPVVPPPPVAGYPIGWCIRAKPEVFADAKKAGYEFVELALQDVLSLSDEDFTKLAARLDEIGLSAWSGYNSVPKELKLVGPEVDQAKLDLHLAKLLSRAAALKLRFLILNSGPSWKMPDGMKPEDGLAELAAFGRKFAKAASSHGITVLVEPLRTTDSNQITTIDEAVKLVEAVDHPHFAMMVDYSFITIQQDNPANLMKAAKHLRHIHIANPANKRRYAMADDESDYASFFRVLKQIGYRGGLSVHGGTTPEAWSSDASRAITFLRAKAKELATN